METEEVRREWSFWSYGDGAWGNFKSIYNSQTVFALSKIASSKTKPKYLNRIINISQESSITKIFFSFLYKCITNILCDWPLAIAFLHCIILSFQELHKRTYMCPFVISSYILISTIVWMYFQVTMCINNSSIFIVEFIV